MSLTFAHPPHLSQYRDESPPRSLVLRAPESERNPHDLPQFDAEKTCPVLYLPPLLSSLPETFPSAPIPPKNPPLITQTRLPNIDPASLSLHKALHHFKPCNEYYASWFSLLPSVAAFDLGHLGTPYGDAFNWNQLVLPAEEEREWYCVAFRSKRKAGSDAGPLYDADKKAHEEAVHNGGLLMYWYGVPSQDTGMNLATCIWQSRKHAIAANSRPHHIRAMKLAADSYEVYDLERYVLRKVGGATGVTVEHFNGGEVGW